MKKNAVYQFFTIFEHSEGIFGLFLCFFDRFLSFELIKPSEIWTCPYLKFIFSNFMLKLFFLAIEFEKKNFS